MSAPVPVTDNSFDAQVLKCDIPVLTDFWAEWSGPCQVIEAHLDQIATAYPEQLKIVKLDIESNPLTTSNYSVLKIPTLILFKNGQPVARLVGTPSKDDIIKQVVPYLDK
jgi:thioredoxin 1